MEEIIDQPVSTREKKIQESFIYWEKKRVWYNLLVGMAGIIGLYMHPLPMDEFTAMGNLPGA